MKKFYVKSGEVRWTFSAKNSDAAAIRLINLTLAPAFIQGQQPVDQYQMVDWQRAKELITRLGKRINVSEQGFSPREYDSFPTQGCLQRWQQQIQAMEKMIRQSK